MINGREIKWDAFADAADSEDGGECRGVYFIPGNRRRISVRQGLWQRPLFLPRWPLFCPDKTGLFHFAVRTSHDFSEILNHSDLSTPCDLNPLFRKRLITPCPVSDVRYRPVPVAKCNETLVVSNGWSIPSADRLGEDSDRQRPRQIGRKVNGVARFPNNPSAADFFVLGPVVSRNGPGVETGWIRSKEKHIRERNA